ncbi:DNA methyltransferase [Botrimarina hoheduenensis]|uniref:DNA adenine methyltransferase YhdJ n=1 Tax=Botrimarina hoheduenensis TaxID=2528000 RepID=A0A5C5W6V5_9BACT|nr:DNA methyltransferase [Botrimarina hoheduenensis]TWT46420.1 DNA adenine methyltransferase YhdJ [Botrimarina hoheduenensis]
MTTATPSAASSASAALHDTTSDPSAEEPLALDRIHQGDCVELLSRLPDHSIDLAFADPPFNIGFKYDEYDDSHQDEHYLAWCERWIAELQRVVKPSGSFWLAIGDEYAAELKVAAKRQGFTPRNWVIWYYTFGQNCRRKFNRSHAHLFHFVQDEEQHTFNAEDPAVRVPSARALVYGDRRANPTGRLPDDTWILRPQDLREEPDAFQPMDDTWYFSRVAGTFKERQGFHGCQMPEQLLGRIVRTCSRPGDLVLDPFAGSGTTLAVAKKLGRQFLGFELSTDYAKYGNQRIEALDVGDDLNGPADPVGSAPTTAKGRRLKGHPLVGPTAHTPQEAEASPVETTAASLSAKEAPTPVSSAHASAAPTAPVGLSLRELTEQALIEAFSATRDGASVDWLLCDAALQSRFHADCAKAGLLGGPTDWNLELLRLRKAGKLPRLKSVSRQDFSSDELDRVAFAAEIAWCESLRKHAVASLDELFCTPDKAQTFDKIAAKYAGWQAESVTIYRWAALRLRKARHALAEEAKRYHYVLASREFERFQAFPRMRVNRYDGLAGLYLLRESAHKPVYLGETHDLGRRLEDHRGAKSGLRKTAQVAVITAEELPSDDYRQPLWVALVQRHAPRLNLAPVSLDA